MVDTDVIDIIETDGYFLFSFILSGTLKSSSSIRRVTSFNVGQVLRRRRPSTPKLRKLFESGYAKRVSYIFHSKDDHSVGFLHKLDPNIYFSI